MEQGVRVWEDAPAGQLFHLSWHFLSISRGLSSWTEVSGIPGGLGTRVEKEAEERPHAVSWHIVPCLQCHLT